MNWLNKERKTIALDSVRSKRSKDANGFLTIKDNPIYISDVLEYNLSELDSNIKEGGTEDRVVNVLKDWESVRDNKEMFSNKPLVWNHNWVGGETTEKGYTRTDNQKADGVIGSDIKIDEDNRMLLADLTIFNQDLIDLIENDELKELSPAMNIEHSEKPVNGSYNGKTYELIQYPTSVNHLAVVSHGRAGKSLTVQDKKRNEIMDKEDVKKTEDECGKVQDDEGALIAKLAEINESGAPSAEKLGEIRKLLDESENMAMTRAEHRRLDILERILQTDKNDEDKTKDIEKVLVDMSDWKPDEEKSSDNKTADEEFKEDITEKKEIESDGDDKKTITITEDELEKKIEKKVEDRIRRMEDARRKESAKIQDAARAVFKHTNQTFDFSGKSEEQIYSIGYNLLTGRKLQSGLDAKTAFNLTAQTKSTANNIKIEDSKKINNNYYASMYDKLNKM